MFIHMAPLLPPYNQYDGFWGCFFRMSEAIEEVRGSMRGKFRDTEVKSSPYFLRSTLSCWNMLGSIDAKSIPVSHPAVLIC